MTANFAKLLELLRKLGTMPVHLIRRRKWPGSPAVGRAGLSVEKEATIQMASFCSCQLSLMTTLITILDS